MKNQLVILVLFLLFGASQVNAQCVIPTDANYNSANDRVKWTESDRSSIYTFTWGNNTMTQKIGMFGGGQGKVTLGFEPGNTNSPSVYLFGGIQNGDLVTISKWCGNVQSTVITFTVQ